MLLVSYAALAREREVEEAYATHVVDLKEQIKLLCNRLFNRKSGRPLIPIHRNWRCSTSRKASRCWPWLMMRTKRSRLQSRVLAMQLSTKRSMACRYTDLKACCPGMASKSHGNP